MNLKGMKLENFNNRDESSPKLFQFQNSICFICGGHYGPCFDDPTCSICHAFFYSNIPSEAHNMIILQEDEDDSDSASEDCDNQTSFAQIKSSSQQELVETNTESLPTEVLINVFKYLDDISLWSVSQVCIRWQMILNMYIGKEYWKNFTLLRWPLLLPTDNEQNWFDVYTTLIQSSSCIKCLRQMAAHEFSMVEQNPERNYQLKSEYRFMRLNPLEGIQTTPLDPLYYHWQATIQGPIGSPYEKGIFFLYIQTPYTYPLFPPIIRFLTRILHPNISRHGDIAMDYIHQKWSSDLNIRKVLISIESLLINPNRHMWMEPEVSCLYMHNRKEFEEQARLWTWKYAQHDL